ncbi:MAG: hypothetical protein PHV32_18485 [Eubacteriales bacterium]|nr:hypothetical protein [Eubacteriales bacterium]
MPRMSKKMKLEWSCFIKENGRRDYNTLCRKCMHDCKQSFRAIVNACRKYQSKRGEKSWKQN